MPTITETSEARQMCERLQRMPALIGVPAPNAVSHPDYAVGYYSDDSILIWSKNDGYIVLDDQQTYYRDTVEHLARCLGLFTKQQRAAMVKGEPQWIDGIHWSGQGEYLGM